MRQFFQLFYFLWLVQTYVLTILLIQISKDEDKQKIYIIKSYSKKNFNLNFVSFFIEISVINTYQKRP